MSRNRNRSQSFLERRISKGQNPSRIGLIGFGHMGTSIAARLLAAGHPVVGIDEDAAKRRATRGHILSLLRGMKTENILLTSPARAIRNFRISDVYRDLQGCEAVVESVKEDVGDQPATL